MLEWTTACPDWQDRIREGRSLMPCGAIFPDQAEAGLRLFHSLFAVGVPNPDGDTDETGRQRPPTYGQVCRPWISEIAEAIHGAYNVETGERLIREALIKVPKKNWKSGLAGGLMLSLMLRNWRDSNEAAIIAPTKEAADNVFKPMRDAIRADAELDTLFHIQPNIRTITHRVTGMSCRVYAADTDTIAGKIWAFVIFEELWLLAQRKGAADLVLEATGGQASRPEGVVISITTESDTDPVGVYDEKLKFARGVRDGKIHAPHFLPLLYEWPEDMLKSKAYLDPANFHLLNPNYGASVDPTDFLRKFEEAQAAGGESFRLFLAKRLNVPPSENMAGSWAGTEFWQQCTEADLVTLDAVLKRSEVAVIGIDGGGLDDLLGLAVLGRDREFSQVITPEHWDEEGNLVPEAVHMKKRWLLWVHAWAHTIVLKRRQDIAEALQGFAKARELTMVRMPGDDVAAVADIVCKVRDAGLLAEKGIGVDGAGIGDIVDELTSEQRGFELEQIIAISQGWRLNAAIKTTERKLPGRELVHGGSGLMAWCVGNAKAEPKGNAVAITKQVAGSAKIDPLMALFNAVTLMALNPIAGSGRVSQGFVELEAA